MTKRKSYKLSPPANIKRTKHLSETKELKEKKVDERSRRKRMRTAEAENDQLMENNDKSQSEIGGAGVEQVDRISQLPEPVIHHILSLLPTPGDVVRTSILSRKWRDIWVSFGVLYFDQRKYLRGRTEDAFRDSVDRSLQRLVSRNCSVKKMTLHISSVNSCAFSHLNRSINSALVNNIQELDLKVNIRGRRFHRYCLPSAVFSSKTVTSLRLCGCTLDICEDIQFSALKKLSLVRIHVDEYMIQRLISSCPLIVDLRLVFCRGLKSFKLANLRKLERVDLHSCYGLTSVDLQASSLLSFCYHGSDGSFCDIDLASSKSLKYLTLEDADYGQFCRDNFNCLSALEKLLLCNCSTTGFVSISSPQLKKLILRRCRNLSCADINAPNLLEFDYESNEMPFLTLDPSNLKKIKLVFYLEIHGKHFEEFLKRFGDYKGLKFVISYEKNVFVHEEPTEILLPPVLKFKLEIFKSSMSFEDQLEILLSTSHPETISVCNRKLIKMIREKLMNREENPSCCTYNSINKCWRHSLESVIIGKRFMTSYVSGDYMMRTWNVWVDSWAASPVPTVIFQLKWKAIDRRT